MLLTTTRRHNMKAEERSEPNPPPGSNSLKRSRAGDESASCETTFVTQVKRTRLLIEAAMNPHELFLQLSKAQPMPSLSQEDYFHVYSEEELESYTTEVTDAVRSLDLVKLRSMKEEGVSLQCSNAFGESLIHMACRRGSFEVVHFFTHEAGVDVKCIDDLGRTPLHDACWTAEPNFELVEHLVSISPSLLLMADIRGHCPLQYIRREHWPLWKSFLRKHEDTLSSSFC